MRNFLNKLNIFLNAKENPHLTQYLVQNSAFNKFVHKTEFMKKKFWQKLDEAAFPDAYSNKLLEQNKKNSKK